MRGHPLRVRHHSFWGWSCARCGTTVGINCGGPEPGQNGTSDDQNQAAATEKHVCAGALPGCVTCASLFTAVFRETPDHVAAARPLCVRRRRGGRRPQLAPRERSFGSARDPLTGLPNRVLLDDRIEQAFRRSRRSGEPFTLIAIDLDGFKDVNDVRGHRAGDLVLKSLARRFEAIVRETDTVARVATSSSSSRWARGATIAPERSSDVYKMRCDGRFVDGAAVEIDGSIGWSVFPDDGSTAEEPSSRTAGRCTRRSAIRATSPR